VDLYTAIIECTSVVITTLHRSYLLCFVLLLCVLPVYSFICHCRSHELSLFL